MLLLKKWLLFGLLLMSAFTRVNATEYQPWVGNIYEFEWRNSLIYQQYSQVSSGSHLKRKSGHDTFFNVSVLNTISEFSPEIEVLGANTHRQPGNIDSLKVNGRYVWKDDVAGDAITLTTGVSLTKAFWPSLKDVSSFHHGLGEAELFVSFGRERSVESDWVSRWWGMVGIGVAERGSPWMRIQGDYDMQWNEKHRLKLFCHTLWGLGRERLHLQHFHGYGSIRHQSVDLGIKYDYQIEFVGSVSCQYSYRVYALNFPAYTHRVVLQVLYTFGL
ncbi:MAG: hypothetical protein Q8K60_07880 [Parachlamydiaceae bacterium]|nr:hypothetical protein [Parachlamydiaceae bacterium]